jgi:hypothetical protein
VISQTPQCKECNSIMSFVMVLHEVTPKNSILLTKPYCIKCGRLYLSKEELEFLQGGKAK